MCSGKHGSVRRRSFATFTAKFVGTLVNSDATSKETRVIAGGRVRPAIKVENSAEFLTWDVALPTSRDRIDTRCFVSREIDEGGDRSQGDSWFVDLGLKCLVH